MPIVHIHMFEGRTIDQKRAMVKGVTGAIVDSIGCKPEVVRIVIHEIQRQNVGDAGVLVSERK